LVNQLVVPYLTKRNHQYYGFGSVEVMCIYYAMVF